MNRSLAGLLIVAAMALGSTQTLLAQVLRGPIEDAWPSQNSADPPLLEPPLLVGPINQAISECRSHTSPTGYRV